MPPGAGALQAARLVGERVAQSLGESFLARPQRAQVAIGVFGRPTRNALRWCADRLGERRVMWLDAFDVHANPLVVAGNQRVGVAVGA